MLVEKGDCTLERISFGESIIVAAKKVMSDALINMNLADIGRGASETTILLKV